MLSSSYQCWWSCNEARISNSKRWRDHCLWWLWLGLQSRYPHYLLQMERWQRRRGRYTCHDTLSIFKCKNFSFQLKKPKVSRKEVIKDAVARKIGIRKVKRDFQEERTFERQKLKNQILSIFCSFIAFK